MKFILILVAVSFVGFQQSAFSQCPYSINFLPHSTICSQQNVSVSLTITSSSQDWIDGDVTWYVNGSTSPLQTTGILLTTIGQSTTVSFTYLAQAGTQIRYVVSDIISSCSLEGTYTSVLTSPPNVNQLFAKKCDDNFSRIQFTSNSSQINGYQLYFTSTSNPAYSYLAASANGYFQIPTDNEKNYFVKPLGTCAGETYYSVSYEPLPQIIGNLNLCVGNSTVLEVNNLSGTFEWSNQNEIINGQSSTYTLPSNTSIGQHIIRVKQISTTCKSLPSEVIVNISPLPQNGIINVNSSSICLGQSIEITSSGGVGIPYYWASTTLGETWDLFQEQFIGISSFSFSPTSIGTYRFLLKNKTACGFCNDQNNCSPAYVDVQVTDQPVSGLITASSTTIVLGDAVTISSSGGTGIPTYSCIKLSNPSQYIFERQYPSQASFNHTPSEPGIYRYSLINKTACDCVELNNCNSLPYVDVSVIIQNNYNFIRESLILKPAVVDINSITSLSIGEKNVNTTYFDGLGREMQKVQMQGSPSHMDVVLPVMYDEYGLNSRTYLPITINKSNGWYTPNDQILDENGLYTGLALNYYFNSLDKISDDLRPFSETIFEPSPLNRPIQSFGPGQQWKDNDKAISHGYFVNIHGSDAGQERIVFWEIVEGVPVKSALNNSSVSGGYYLSGQLSIKSTKDEHGNEVREYINKEGKTILKKVQVFAGSAQINIDSHWAHTYYIYDDLGNLIMVLPPEAVKALAN